MGLTFSPVSIYSVDRKTFTVEIRDAADPGSADRPSTDQIMVLPSGRLPNQPGRHRLGLVVLWLYPFLLTQCKVWPDHREKHTFAWTSPSSHLISLQPRFSYRTHHRHVRGTPKYLRSFPIDLSPFDTLRQPLHTCLLHHKYSQAQYELRTDPVLFPTTFESV